jgi:hypothetical protein
MDRSYTGYAPGGYVGALPASNEVDYLDLVAGFELNRIVLRARYHGVVDFDSHAASAHFEPFKQRGQAGVALDRVLLAVELDREAGWHLGHRKSRFPDCGQAALGGTAIVPPQ